MNVRELNREQLNELKQAYVADMVENPSWGELADSENIPDEIIYTYYEGVHFVPEDFSCVIARWTENGRCSNCGWYMPFDCEGHGIETDYCPFCGAKMIFLED